MKTNEIKKWAIDHVSLAQIAREAEASKQLVSRVIRGDRTTGPKARRVIEVFLGRGCPPELLGLDTKTETGQGKQEAA